VSSLTNTVRSVPGDFFSLHRRGVNVESVRCQGFFPGNYSVDLRVHSVEIGFDDCNLFVKPPTDFFRGFSDHYAPTVADPPDRPCLPLTRWRNAPSEAGAERIAKLRTIAAPVGVTVSPLHPGGGVGGVVLGGGGGGVGGGGFGVRSACLSTICRGRCGDGKTPWAVFTFAAHFKAEQANFSMPSAWKPTQAARGPRWRPTRRLRENLIVRSERRGRGLPLRPA